MKELLGKTELEVVSVLIELKYSKAKKDFGGKGKNNHETIKKNLIKSPLGKVLLENGFTFRYEEESRDYEASLYSFNNKEVIKRIEEEIEESERKAREED